MEFLEIKFKIHKLPLRNKTTLSNQLGFHNLIKLKRKEDKLTFNRHVLVF